MSDNVVLAKHFDSLAAAVQRYMSAGFVPIAGVPAGSSVVLDTVPATVDGGLWYELEAGSPVVKFNYGSDIFVLSSALSPNLSVTPSASSTDGDDITATISYSGGGTVTVESDNSNVTPTLSGSTITVPYHAFTDDDHSVTITVSVAANGNYSAQSATFQVLFEKVEAYLDPQLNVEFAVEGWDDIGPMYGYQLSYLGNGTITVTSSNSSIETSYDATTRTLTVYFVSNQSTTVTVSLSASPPYTAASLQEGVSFHSTPPPGNINPIIPE